MKGCTKRTRNVDVSAVLMLSEAKTICTFGFVGGNKKRR